MRALVTGATGLVGSHLVEELLKSYPEYSVRVLIRPASDKTGLDDKRLEIAWGDLTQPQSLQEAVRNVDVIFHCAAFVSDWASRQEMIKINVTGLKDLLEASIAKGVRRFVLISSMAVLGMGKQENLDESAPYVRTGDLYNYTKIEAEKLALDYGKKGNLSVTVIRPPYIYGPRDRQMLPRILAFLKEEKFVYINGGNNPFHLVYVGNLVQAMLLAATVPVASGQIYHVTDGVSITRRELIEFIAESLHYAKPTKSVPLELARVACFVMEVICKMLKSKKTPPLNRFRLKFMSTYLTFSIDKATKQIGYQPEPQKDCLRRTLDWYRGQVENTAEASAAFSNKNI